MIAETEGDVVGFITIEKENHNLARYGIKIGTFVLNAVSPQYRNLGIYSALIKNSIRFISNYANLVEVRTQANNVPVFHTLLKNGFHPVRTQITFHHWNPITTSITY
ncbi:MULTISPECIES: GNAT family N-acetyltransferase [unclassified Methanoregula]|uniref:GNAT family N-acetyltransferase n=1 Tax=unclassified Methanoregula TaxID=2649730 RepID=UPI0009D03F88|nr:MULTISPECIES: GNAT family N-acetyltransferase [unclassified Methanoregula]OPX65132.1 MAG: hypothetical protein A4E33_00163 [Methanoregula sp. PtaB.Bin085]OPY32044.1 MAG: hypothetical protein A4E34_02416 [Methanoregula sp. PtaU1.Bin006]